MAEKLKQEKKKEEEKQMLIGFYKQGEEVGIESYVDPCVERELAEMLANRANTEILTLQRMSLTQLWNELIQTK
jgi:helix-turn-helix protein